MVNALLAMSAFFMHGDWSCSYYYAHEEQNVKEEFIGNIKYNEDLSYSANHYIHYSYLASGKIFGKFSYKSSGRAHLLSDSEFYLESEGNIKNLKEDFDPTNHFTNEYLSELSDYLNENIAKEDKTLTVLIRSNEYMEVVHKKSGTITKCKPNSSVI